ncbi:hypothetical protein [Wolbachia pipientis]|uniref:hypothetical protein n=1 Tax=Wolbachia pipientis TaxID=955 RepID=UPI00202FA7A1|nr:hypothetical protein [Wolbachia pipientis]MCM1002341.1 hypothetical protein [Wolbachia pipientis]
MLVGLAVVGGGALLTGAGAAVGSSVTSSKYNKIMSELKAQHREALENFKKKMKAVEEKYSSLIRENVKEKEKLEREKIELMKSFEKSQKELVDLMTKMAKAEEEAEKRYQESINQMRQEKKDLMKKYEEDKKELTERSNQEKQELRELIKKLDKERNETQLVNQELLAKMNTILNLPSVSATIQNLQGADKSNSKQTVTENLQESSHSNTTITQDLYETNSTTQASNTATESSDELDDDIVVVSDPSSYIDELILSSQMSNNLSK